MRLPDDLAAFVKPILAICASQFPRRCANCGAVFSNFKKYVAGTCSLGAPQCSAKLNDPFGLISYRNCACGSTIMLRCADSATHDEFYRVLRKASARTGHGTRALLLALRNEVHRRALESPPPRKSRKKRAGRRRRPG